MTHAPLVEHELPRQVVEALRAGLGERLVAVVLFGSRARGDHRPTSDWDLLVITLDGQILYDPTGYAAQRLAQLRRLIEQAGLYRERTPAGDVWRWQAPPRGPWVMSWERIGAAG